MASIRLISIHALHEESDPDGGGVSWWDGISIHALHEESDQAAGIGRCEDSTISIHALHEESDREMTFRLLALPISIHALHEESDYCPVSQTECALDFNPRSP